jgi:DNA-binding IclR family transcriptional regulator
VVDTELKTDGQATIERVAKLTWALAHGEGLRVKDVATITGLSKENARRMLCKISRVIPVYDDPDTHMWQALAMQEAET